MKRARTDSAAPSNVQQYRDCFLRRVHQLLKLGYDRMTPARFANRDEEVITQELVRTIEQVLDDPSGSITDWIDYFSVHDVVDPNSWTTGLVSLTGILAT